jgi:thiamine-phosphate pyrophosphorylase
VTYHDRWRRGLYAVTDGRSGAPLLDLVEAVLRGGAVLLQYRAKATPPARRREEATALLALCRRHGVPLVINDDLDLAVASGADGIHLGRDDAPPAEARRALGDAAIIGVSCYAESERATAAVAAGADYVAFGSLFPSPTKPGAPPAPPGLLAQARRELGVPVCGIGGITLANAPRAIAAGADLLAVISDLAEADDPNARAAAYAALFAAPRS